MNATVERLLQLIESTSGRIFTATFLKRSDDTIRKMTCRLGVKSHLDPDATPDPDRPARDRRNDLVTVFDVQSNGYRCIPLDRILSVTIDGQTFTKEGA